MKLAALALLCALACAAPARREVIFTEAAPKPVGPYSQAIKVGDQLFLAGQGGIDPATGKLVPGGAVPEARQALDNLVAVAKAAGFELADVVEVQIFLTDIDQFAAVNKVYAEYFPVDPPARATIQAARLPVGCSVEIRASAVRSRH